MPSPADAGPLRPTAQTVVMTTMPSPENAGLDQSRLLSPRPQHLPMMNCRMPLLTVKKSWMWAKMATWHPLLPKPLQPRASTSPPPNPSTPPEKRPPPQAGASQHPQAWARHRGLLPTYGFVPVMNKVPRSTSRPWLAPADSLTLVQHNSLGSWDVILSLFCAVTESPPIHVVLLHDPPSSKGFLHSFSGFKSLAPSMARPRVACYIPQKFQQKFAVLPVFPSETDDIMAFDVFTPHGCFGSTFPRFRIGNSYARPLPLGPLSASAE